MSEAPSVTIRHKTDRNCVRVTPLLWRPADVGPNGLQPCNLCKIIHTHKAIHFTLGPNGEAIISKDLWPVLEKIGPKYGMDPRDGFSLVGEVDNPPPLGVLGPGPAGPSKHDRTSQDNAKRKQVIYGSETKGAISHGSRTL
jgi:hypothetical protein